MTLKAMKKALADIYETRKTLVEEYGADELKQYNAMTYEMDGVVRAVIYCHKDYWKKLQDLEFEYQDKFCEEVRA